MIELKQLSKRFGDLYALKNLNLTIPEGCIYGLVGSNGAGKSTLLRLISGVYKASSGTVTLSGAPVYDNPKAKADICSLADDLYLPSGANMYSVAATYAASYEGFSPIRMQELAKLLGLDPRAPFGRFSKGMRRQAAIALALACNTKYLLLDETFDGLDPVMRSMVKRLLYAEAAQRSFTVVIASHSLRELEDTCDQLTLLHKGGIVFESDIQDLKTSLFKVQIACPAPFGEEIFDGLSLLEFHKQGSVATAIVRGDRDEAYAQLRTHSPLLLELLPLTLEEVFVHEMSALGYQFDLSLLEGNGNGGKSA